MERRRQTRKSALLALAVVAALAALSATTASASAPIAITFVKSVAGPGYYTGTTGDGGVLEMWVSAADAPEAGQTGNMQHFNVRIEATPGNGQWFAAELRGTFNSSTGKTLLTGTVTEGWLAGARAREQGSHLGGGTFQGTLWLLPATA